MTSEDDPEARIRELEQPLAEAARASEAGENPRPSKWAPPSGASMPPPTGPPLPPPTDPRLQPPPQSYAPPPGPAMQPPPLPYGGSFTGPSFSGVNSRSNRGWWILAAVFVIGMIALPAAIFLFTAHQVSRSGLPTMFPTPMIPSPPSGMTQTPAFPPSSAPTPEPPAPAPAGENVTVSGISESRTIACNGGSVSVSGITNNVVITGHCASLSVSGIQNQITVDTVDAIQTSGSGNQVTYHSGSPKIGTSGFDNVVKQG
jgi:hypothetical protein